jgi:hypothetical protein
MVVHAKTVLKTKRVYMAGASSLAFLVFSLDAPGMTPARFR